MTLASALKIGTCWKRQLDMCVSGQPPTGSKPRRALTHAKSTPLVGRLPSLTEQMGDDGELEYQAIIIIIGSVRSGVGRGGSNFSSE